MPGTTTHGFRYPSDTDPVNDGAEAVRNLANDVDDRVGAFACGSVVVAVAAATNASAAVVFPAGRFAAAPRVVATINGALLYGASTSAITAAGCNIHVRHLDNTSATVNVTVHWIAMDQS